MAFWAFYLNKTVGGQTGNHEREQRGIGPGAGTRTQIAQSATAPNVRALAHMARAQTKY